MQKTRKMILFCTLALSMILTLSAGHVEARQSPTVITMWHIAVESDSFYSVLPPAIERFNATHTDVQIEAQAIQNDAFKTQIQVAIAAGEQPDIFMTWGGGLLQSYVEGGVVRDIPELDTELGANFIPGGFAPSTFDGKHYAVPANLAGVFLYYNKDLFEQFDLSAPATWDELISSCETFSENGIIPIALGNVNRWTGSFWFMNLVLRSGGPEPFMNAFNRVDGASFTDPAFVEAGTKIQEAVEAGCFGEGFNGVDYPDEQLLFGTGLAAMELQGDWNYAGLLNIDAEIAENSVDVVPFPLLDSEMGDPNALVGGTGQAFAISADAPAEANVALIELLGSEEFGLSVAENGFIPALKGFDQNIEVPIVQKMASLLSQASFVQLAYDQFLPPELAQVHLDTTQQLFGLSTSPEDAAAETEAAAVEILGAE
ncbi:MAG: sugar ABC transporter substrate-binding protein [Chloroflexota bacterium]|nr:extracellular solute-binding protein [Chloroflexota bacterium]NOG65338.1 extracellular solute-binding protein [Chloroflexota bacterium]GIK66726.1 MAG: sugar ABC transporter substrate-binding protein [Chloroflexota bacterium]